MKEVLLTSSVLILLLLLLRALFRSAISRRLQYALWGIVLLRLLLPFQLPALEHNVLTASAPLQQVVTEQMEQGVFYVRMEESPVTPTAPLEEPPQPAAPPANTWVNEAAPAAPVQYQTYTAGEILTYVWYIGMAGMALWLLVSNHFFYRKMCKVRKPYTISNCKYPVYLVEKGLPSPCLFGVLRPAIYLTPGAVANKETLRHVLAHEITHARHLDPLWALLRGVCLVVYWFNPLVWAAAFASRVDCELACDEGALRLLGEEERIPYGKTLLALIPVRKAPVSPLLSATTMTSGKRRLKERICCIAEHRQTVQAAVFTVVALVVMGCAMTFTGSKPETTPPNNEPPQFTAQEMTSHLPAWSPEQGINLDDLTPFGPQDVELFETDSKSVRAHLPNSTTVTIGNYSVIPWQEESGVYHVSFGRSDGNIGAVTYYDLLVCPGIEEGWEYTIGQFTNLLGHNGFVLSYYYDADRPDGYKGAAYTLEDTPVNQYYAIIDGAPKLIAYTLGTNVGTSIADLNGDGIKELYTCGYWTMEDYNDLYFFRDNAIYAVRLADLCQQVYPHWSHINMGNLQENFTAPGKFQGRFFTATGGYTREDGSHVDAQRRVYFTGESLYFYQDEREIVDHVMTPDQPIDETVLNMAREQVETTYRYYTVEWQQEGGYRPENDPAYDNWRIENISLAKEYPFTAGTIEVYRMNFEFHASKPQNVVLAGGMYHWENDWVMPSYPNCFYLAVLNREGKREFLYYEMVNDSAPGVSTFDYYIVQRAIELGLTTLEELDGSMWLTYLDSSTDHFLDVLSQLSPEEQKAVVSKVCYYRTSGTREEQEIYDRAIQTYSGLYTEFFPKEKQDVWNLILDYHAPQRTMPTEEESEQILQAARNYMEDYGSRGGSRAFTLLSLSIDDVESQRVVQMYTDSAVAVAGGFDHDTMRRYTAVQAVYDIVYDILWNGTEVSYNDKGRSAQYLYLLPTENGSWNVIDSMGCALPERYEMAIRALCASPTVTLNLDPSLSTAHTVSTNSYRNSRLESLLQDFTWTQVEGNLSPTPPARPSLTIAAPESGISLTFWENSTLARVVTFGELIWYNLQPRNASDDTSLPDDFSVSIEYLESPFGSLRPWYDDAEWEALTRDIVIPDEGQGHLEIAQEWTDRTTQAALNVTSGSVFACTYVRAQAELVTDLSESVYPAFTDGMERFYFRYTRVFVPETRTAWMYQIAGNTTNYDGSLGDAPEGAQMNWQMGPMYRTAEGWRCDGTGTGP